MHSWRELITDDSGATAVEYGMLVALIGLAVSGLWLSIGDSIDRHFTTVAQTLAS